MDKEMKLFDFTDVFTAERGTRLIEKDQVPGDIAYISSTKMNNGINSFITPPEKMVIYERKITLSNSGSVGHMFFHEYPFVASDHATVIGMKESGFELTKEIALYLRPIFEAIRYKYNFGREISDKRINGEKILLPVKSGGEEPDWSYMSEYIKNLRTKIKWNGIKTQENNHCLLTDVPWKEITIDSLFCIKKGKRLTKADMIEGNTNFIGAISGNNGVREKIVEDALCEGNCITVNYNGSVGEAYYQADPFWASDDVNVLFLKDYELNKYIALFLITIIRQNKVHFDFGRKWNVEKMKSTQIKVPISEDGEINWKFMENYIKGLSVGHYI